MKFYIKDFTFALDRDTSHVTSTRKRYDGGPVNGHLEGNVPS